MAKKKDKRIKLSPKYGLNPSIEKCPICGKEGGIIFYGKLKGDVEAPKYTSNTLCEECSKEYITLLEAEEDGKCTGRCIYIKRSAVAKKYQEKNYLLMTKKDFENTLFLLNNQ